MFIVPIHQATLFITVCYYCLHQDSGCFYHHLQAVFPQDGDWMIQLFARAVNTSNYQPVVRLRVTSTVQVHDRLYPTIETTHFSRFQLKIDESKLPLLSKLAHQLSLVSLIKRQPDISVELLHHARDKEAVCTLKQLDWYQANVPAERYYWSNFGKVVIGFIYFQLKS